jgi:hypothetical protein
MSDPTNDELRRRIAEMLGWLFVKQVRDPIDSHLFLEGSPPGNIHVTHVLPKWPEDLNAAARDCLTRMPDFGLYWLPKAQQWEIYNPQDLFMLEVNPDPARAICLAFVAMEEKKVDE